MRPKGFRQMNKLMLLILSVLTLGLAPAARDEKQAGIAGLDQDRIIVYTPSAGKKPYAFPGRGFALFTYSTAVFGLPIAMTPGFELQPGFIKDWFWDFKDKKYRLKIDSNYRFHNGRKVTAQDVEFMLLKSYFMEQDRQDKKWLINLRGSAALKDKKGTKFRSGLIEGVKVVDEGTLDLYLENENPTFLYNLTRSIPPLVPIEEMKEDYLNFKNGPVGAGNYKVIFDDPKSTLVRLERIGPDNGVPKIVDIIGDCDFKKIQPDIILGPLSSIGLTGPTEYRSIESPLAVGVSNIFFNFQHPAGAHKGFRKMIDLLIDRQRLDPDDHSRSSLFELLPVHFWGRVNRKNPYNIEEARRIYASLPDTIKKMQHILEYHAAVERPAYIQSLDEQMKSLGLNVKFVRGTDALIEKNEAITMFAITTTVDFQDPLNVFSYFLSDGARPYQHPPGNTDFDELFYRALKARNKAEQAESIKLLSQKLLDDVYIAPLYELKMQFHIGKRIRTIGEQNFGPYLDLEQVRLK
jgi:ABC-type transport system substrate-binding protein